jgi:hypothetical protein
VAGANIGSSPNDYRLEGPDTTHSSLVPIYDTVVELFHGFHHSRKPVLWRVLVYQYMLYRALLSAKPDVALR